MVNQFEFKPITSLLFSQQI